MNLFPGMVCKTRSISVYQTLPNGKAELINIYKPQKKVKGKYTQNMLFCYLGTEDIVNQVSDAEVIARMGDLGWKKMTDDEYKKHAQSRGSRMITP